ncbi:MAG: sugar kinase [Candidatus Gastranaerophilales bacterium]|nr:sugar kinase [Candidatus Gastranaerophilales bacterium]
MFESTDIVCIGESLTELSTNESLAYAETLNKYFGGDTMTTAVSASRLGAKVGYITVIGNDYLKDFLMEACTSEGLETSQIRLSDGANGLYIVARCKNNKKEFVYYRKKTAATSLCEANIAPDYIKNTKIVYATGITQSLSLSANEAVKTAFRIAKDNGVKVAYDINYATRIWDISEAKEAFEEVLPYIDIFFANFDHDLKPLFGWTSPDLAIKTLMDKGVSNVIIRDSEGNISLGYNGEIITKKQLEVDEIADTTGSGDAFNGAFLYGIVNGYTPFEAMRLGMIINYYQVQSLGAIKSLPNHETVLNHYNNLE